MNIRKELFNNQDSEYRDFHSRLVPNIDKEKIIGVRLPQLREIGKKLADNNFSWDYYEEIMLHGFYIGYSKLPFNEKLELLKEFIPRIDNWAVCDCVCSSLKFVNKNKEDFLSFLKPYMNSGREYELRFAIVMLMDYYIDDEHIDYVISFLSKIKSDYYYVNMAAAWALSAAFVKYQNLVMPLIESYTLDPFVHNKTISKICDSFRVDKNTKVILKTYRIKKNVLHK